MNLEEGGKKARFASSPNGPLIYTESVSTGIALTSKLLLSKISVLRCVK